ncbi:MAG: hypothetical protein QMC23_07835 [Rubritalea sp.]
MKSKSKIILTILILVMCFTYIGWQINVKNKYEEYIKVEEYFKPILLNEANEKQIRELQQIETDWTNIYDNKTVINSSLDLTGYPRTIEGLVAMWSHRAAPYSFTDHESNKRTVLIKTIQNMSLESGEWLINDKILFRCFKGHASIYIEDSKGITQIVYQDKTKLAKSQ